MLFTTSSWDFLGSVQWRQEHLAGHEQPLHWRKGQRSSGPQVNPGTSSRSSWARKRSQKSVTMAPKGKGAADKGGAAKGKGKGKTDEKEEKGGKVKASQFVNVRHILVQLPQSRKRDRMYIWQAHSVKSMAERRKLWPSSRQAQNSMMLRRSFLRINQELVVRGPTQLHTCIYSHFKRESWMEKEGWSWSCIRGEGFWAWDKYRCRP